MPKSSSWGSSPAITPSAIATTAPSTQPPETAPITRPSSFTAIFAPSGWGADFLVSTTVASATAPPSATQPSTVSSTSFT